jgi:hypothetical protein
MKKRKGNVIGLLWLTLTVLADPILVAAEPSKREVEQKIYVPVYSHIYVGDHERPFLLAATLSIRNTDPLHPITLLTVDYHDSEGGLVRHYLEGSIQLRALAALRFVVQESDKAGGSGASFLVRWKSEKRVSPPIVESVMIGTRHQQGISFTSRGQVIPENQD